MVVEERGEGAGMAEGREREQGGMEGKRTKFRFDIGDGETKKTIRMGTKKEERKILQWRRRGRKLGRECCQERSTRRKGGRGEFNRKGREEYNLEE